jgi:hypothetical protein
MDLWTQFWDMSTGGKEKSPHKLIYIRGDRKEATQTFIERFGRDPEHMTCRCCGVDYSITTEPALWLATAWWRGYNVRDLPGGKLHQLVPNTHQPKTLDQFRQNPEILILE